MKILSIVVSKQYCDIAVPYGWDFHREQPPVKPFHNLNWWPSDIFIELCRKGHTGNFVSVDTPEFMQGHFHSYSPTHYAYSDDCQVTYLSENEDFKKIARTADAYIIRNDFSAYSKLFETIQFENKPVIQIISNPRAGKLRWQPNCHNHYLLVNSQQEINDFNDQGLTRCEIFMKPAAMRFYGQEEKIREFDFLFVCWKTSELRKRFKLFLDGIEQYALRSRMPVNVLVAGDTSCHHDVIQSLQETVDLLTIHTLGEVSRFIMPELFHSAAITVVCSDQDANPQVISESLACNTPVACAADITGGAFQINEHTGKLFQPDAKSLCEALIEMKYNTANYQAGQYCITIDDACEQLEKLLTTPA